MPIEHHQGDLLLSNCAVIAHGCNCFNTMGSGIARAIRARYPSAYEADCATTRGDLNKLGSLSESYEIYEPWIFNLYTQYRYGTDRRHLDYTALVDALVAMKALLDEKDPDQALMVGMPRIGCGLAGGDWQIVEELISNVFHDRTIHIYTL